MPGFRRKLVFRVVLIVRGLGGLDRGGCVRGDAKERDDDGQGVRRSQMSLGWDVAGALHRVGETFGEGRLRVVFEDGRRRSAAVERSARRFRIAQIIAEEVK